jgi:hypothetical protein
MAETKASGYVIEKPNTYYQTEERCPMKFANGDISLDEAVQDILDSGEEFTVPNIDLLIKAVMDTPWDDDNNG